MVDSRRSTCKKLKVVADIVVVVMFVSFLLYFLLPARQDKQEVLVEKTNQEGDNNTVTTIQEREVSIVHIEGLQKGQTTGYLFTVGGVSTDLADTGRDGFSLQSSEEIKEGFGTGAAP